MFGQALVGWVVLFGLQQTTQTKRAWIRSRAMLTPSAAPTWSAPAPHAAIRFLHEPMVGADFQELREAFRQFQANPPPSQALLGTVEALREETGAPAPGEAVAAERAGNSCG